MGTGLERFLSSNMPHDKRGDPKTPLATGLFGLLYDQPAVAANVLKNSHIAGALLVVAAGDDGSSPD